MKQLSLLKHDAMKLAFGALAFAPWPILADTPPAPTGGCATQQGAGLTAVSGSACDGTTLADKVGNVIDALFIVVGAIAVIIIIIGGIRYITSTGNSTRIQQAKDTILYSVIGLIVVILGRAIVGFVIGQVAK